MSSLMKVQCSLCGKNVEINKMDNDYERLSKQPKANYICENCACRLRVEAARATELIRSNP